MFLKNWHEFENKLIVEPNDTFITSDGKELDVIQIYLDKQTTKVFFLLSGDKKVSEESLYKQIKAKKYRHKSGRSFLGKLLSGRGDMYHNQGEVKQFLIDKLKNEQPEQFQHYQTTLGKMHSSAGNNYSESQYSEPSSPKRNTSNQSTLNDQLQTKKDNSDMHVDGVIAIKRFEMYAFGERPCPEWGVKCGACGKLSSSTWAGHLGKEASGYSHTSTCNFCKAHNTTKPYEVHWSKEKRGKIYTDDFWNK